MRRIMPGFLPIAFIMSAIWRCILSSLLTSSGRVPEPEAMRRLRLPSSSFGLRRSRGVIDWMMAIWRFTTLSSRLASDICALSLPMPGSMPIMPDMPPMRSIWRSCSARSSRSSSPLRIFCAIFWAFSTSIVCAAFSTRLTTSPMPRIREAMRLG